MLYQQKSIHFVENQKKGNEIKRYLEKQNVHFIMNDDL